MGRESENDLRSEDDRREKRKVRFDEEKRLKDRVIFLKPTLIILRIRVIIDDIEISNFWTVYEVFPFPFEDLYTRTFVPIQTLEMSNCVWVGFDDDVT